MENELKHIQNLKQITDQYFVNYGCLFFWTIKVAISVMYIYLYLSWITTRDPLSAVDTCVSFTIRRTYPRRTSLETWSTYLYPAVACARPAELCVLSACSTQNQQQSCATQPCISSLWICVTKTIFHKVYWCYIELVDNAKLVYQRLVDYVPSGS
jgi:hypothetical protein